MKLNTDNSEIMTNYMMKYFEFLELFENRSDLALNYNYGYINTKLENTGTATRFFLKIKAPTEKTKQEEITKKLSESSNDLRFDFYEEDGKSVLEISNINPYYTFSTVMIELLNIKDNLK